MLLVGGENLFDLISDTSDGALSYNAIPGGSPYNTAIAAGKLGGQVAYISPISRDTLGESLVEHLTKAQVQHWGSRVSAPTSLALVNLNQGQASYQFYREQSAERQIDLELLKSACQRSSSMTHEAHPLNVRSSILHIGSLALTGEEDGELWCRLFEWAQSIMFCSVDLNIRPHFIENEVNYRQRLIRIMQSAHLIKLSDEDLCWWIGPENRQQADTNKQSEQDGSLDTMQIKRAATELMHTFQAQLLIVTQGSQGSHLFFTTNPNQELIYSFCSAFKTEQLKDTVGAGDTFMGAFLSQVQDLNRKSHQWTQSDLERALAFASMAAMINCERQGCLPPHQDEVYDRLKKVQTNDG